MYLRLFHLRHTYGCVVYALRALLCGSLLFRASCGVFAGSCKVCARLTDGLLVILHAVL